VQVVQQAATTPQAVRAEILCLLQPLHLVAHVVDIKAPMELRVGQAVALDVIKAQVLVLEQVRLGKAMQVVHLVARNLLDLAAVAEHHNQDFKGLATATAAMNAAATVAMGRHQESPVLP
jgi:hypothetical protein